MHELHHNIAMVTPVPVRYSLFVYLWLPLGLLLPLRVVLLKLS